MNTYINKSISLLVFVAIFTAATVIPERASAQTYATYQPRTQAEMVAYLYGRISQLMEIKAQLERGGSVNVTTIPGLSLVSADTRSASEITATTAFLRGEVILFGDSTAQVWFEYGRDQGFLDQRTNKVNIRSAYDRAVRFQVRNLSDDTRYYFRIVSQDNKGNLQYGPVFSFRTHESN